MAPLNVNHTMVIHTFNKSVYFILGF